MIIRLLWVGPIWERLGWPGPTGWRCWVYRAGELVGYAEDRERMGALHLALHGADRRRKGEIGLTGDPMDFWTWDR